MRTSFDARDAFQRALALCFCLAFCSFYAGSRELVSPRGVEPLQTIIEQRRVPGDILESFSGTPTLIWLPDSLGVEASAAAECFSLLGALLAGAASLGLLGGCTPLFVALSLLYLAVISPLAATARGSSLPWAELSADGLLLEAAFAASLWAPLWPKGEEEEEEEEEEEQGEEEEEGGESKDRRPASSSLSAPALAPAFLLRWIVAKNAFFRGLCRWKKINSGAAAAASSTPVSSLVALVADVALGPLALSPARLPRLVAAAALLVSWAIDVTFQLSSSSSSAASKATTSSSSSAAALWTLLLRPVLLLPLLHAGLLDSSDGKKESGGESGRLKSVTRLLVSAAAAVPAFFSALGALLSSSSPRASPSSGGSFEQSLSRYAPYCLAAAGLTMLASLSADVMRSMSAASVGLEEEGDENEGGSEQSGEKNEKKKSTPPMTLSTRRKKEREQKARRQQQRSERRGVEYVRGTHEPALVGAISLMLFASGCLEILSAVSSPSAAAAGRGCSGGPGCGGGPAALVVARRLSWLARPWRATGPSFQSLMREEGVGSPPPSSSSSPASASVAVALEVRSDCREGGEDESRSSGGGWSGIAPRWRSSRVAAALSALSRQKEGEGDESSPPPPWLDHLLYRLVSDPTGPVAASFKGAAAAASAASAPPPCAARAVVVGKGEKTTTWASFSALEALDASSPASERLARHGWGPLVEYESPSRFGRVVADAGALPRKLFDGGGERERKGGFNVAVAVATAACSVVFSAAALAVVRRRENPEVKTTAAKKRD